MTLEELLAILDRGPTAAEYLEIDAWAREATGGYDFNVAISLDHAVCLVRQLWPDEGVHHALRAAVTWVELEEIPPTTENLARGVVRTLLHWMIEPTKWVKTSMIEHPPLDEHDGVYQEIA